MRHSIWTTIAPMAILLAVSSFELAEARVDVYVDKTTQRMTVEVEGVVQYTWPVSTGQVGYSTPSGLFTPFRMEKDHFSREWDDAPMPHSIFFTHQGHAIHGSMHIGRLGTAASHGCVRLSPENASTLFALVGREGIQNTRIMISGQVVETDMPSRRSVGRNSRKLGRFWLRDRRW
jgi:lipoprotein-anchoring transpeptidase ErfK/SrfK